MSLCKLYCHGILAAADLTKKKKPKTSRQHKPRCDEKVPLDLCHGLLCWHFGLVNVVTISFDPGDHEIP